MDTNLPKRIIEFAERIHRAFPTIPLLGSDIVEEVGTGILYALEVNAIGWTFHLTSPRRERIKREFGIDLCEQFGGAEAVARGLIRRLGMMESN